MLPEDLSKLERFLNGQDSETDREFIHYVFSKGRNNIYLKNVLNQDWEKMLNEDNGVDFDSVNILGQIHNNILKKDLKKANTLQRITRIYLKVAAILLIPILLTGSLLVNNLLSKNKSSYISEDITSVKLYAPLGSRVSFNLPDGTTGMLNSGSLIEYSIPFSNKRNISLEGEAWFEVKADTAHPFNINVPNSTIKVTGTRFNVSAYLDEDYIEVVLLNGKISFIDNINNKESIIQPSEKLVYKKGMITKSHVDPIKYSAWIEGKLVFRDDSMDEIIRRMERWYNIKITIADKELEKYSFHATFQDDSLEDVLKFLAMTSPISYTIYPPTILPNGNLAKSEVRIFKKQH